MVARSDTWRRELRVQVAQVVARALVELGVKHVFGLVGSGNFAVTNALCDAGATFVAARHECAAVCMADGYARVARRVGVATVHQGPGLTNAVTGLAEAAKARTPLLLLAADTSAAAVASNFRIDQAALVRSVGAVAERVHTPASALQDVTRAFRRAVTDRRAVAVMLPLDVQAAQADDSAPLPPVMTATPAAPSPAAVGQVADLLERSRRPAVIAGRGAVLAGARKPLERLGDRIGAVLATSANGNGLFAGSPFALGISGGFASPVALGLLGEADVVLAFGASLNMWTTRHGALIGPGTRVVQVDADAEALGRIRPADVAVVADAAEAATAISAELERRGMHAEGFRTAGLAERIAAGRWIDQPYEDRSSDRTIDPRTLTRHLDRLLPADRTVVIDSGHFMGWPAMYLAVPDADGFVFTQAYQSIGLGLGNAIGAALARPDRLVVAALGDGGALMALGELETAARLRLPMLIVVYNDAAYGAEVHHFGPGGHALDTVRFPDTDFAALARAAGGEGVTVRRPADLEAVTAWLGHRDGPLVVDAKVTPDVVAEWLEEAFRAH
jgi:thiamine pyrophosphate-dependent acetolactate synthase large subunit-like protein